MVDVTTTVISLVLTPHRDNLSFLIASRAVGQEAELMILYNFYVDCMPSDDMAEVSNTQPDSLVPLATSTTRRNACLSLEAS